MKKTLLLALLAAGWAPCAHALDGASITLGWKDLSFTLVDLDPMDGITPSMDVSFDRECSGGDSDVCNDHYFRSDYRPPAADSRLNASDFTDAAPLSVSSMKDRIEFELSSHTALLVTGSLFTTGSDHQRSEPFISGGSPVVWDAYAWGSVQLNLGGGPGPFGVSRLDSVLGPSVMPFAWRLETAADPLRTSFEISGEAWSYATRTLVPEPSTNALLLAGLGVLACAGRKMRRG